MCYNPSSKLDIHRSRIEFFRSIYEEDKRTMLKEWKQDSALFRGMQTEQQEQLECVFYQVQETTDKAVKDNHEHYIDRVEDLKSGVSAFD